VFAEVTAVTGLRSIGTDERQALAEVSASPRAVASQVRSELTNIDFAGFEFNFITFISLPYRLA
jgi:hypothetical protein